MESVMPTEEDIVKKKENPKNGWILEVDLEYPAELHEKHNSYSLRPRETVVQKECMSDNQEFDERPKAETPGQREAVADT